MREAFAGFPKLGLWGEAKTAFEELAIDESRVVKSNPATCCYPLLFV